MTLLTTVAELGEAIALGLVRAGCRRIALADASFDLITRIKDQLLLYAEDTNYFLITLENNEAEDFENMARDTTRHYGQINYCINCSTTNVKSTRTAELDSEMFLAGLKDTSRAVRITQISRVTLANRHRTVMVVHSSRAASDVVPTERRLAKELNR